MPLLYRHINSQGSSMCLNMFSVILDIVGISTLAFSSCWRKVLICFKSQVIPPKSFEALLNNLVFQMAGGACVEAEKSYPTFLSKIREVAFVQNWVQVFVSLCGVSCSCLGG